MPGPPAEVVEAPVTPELVVAVVVGPPGAGSSSADGRLEVVVVRCDVVALGLLAVAVVEAAAVDEPAVVGLAPLVAAAALVAPAPVVTPAATLTAVCVAAAPAPAPPAPAAPTRSATASSRSSGPPPRAAIICERALNSPSDDGATLISLSVAVSEGATDTSAACGATIECPCCTSTIMAVIAAASAPAPRIAPRTLAQRPGGALEDAPRPRGLLGLFLRVRSRSARP